MPREYPPLRFDARSDTAKYTRFADVPTGKTGELEIGELPVVGKILRPRLTAKLLCLVAAGVTTALFYLLSRSAVGVQQARLSALLLPSPPPSSARPSRSSSS